MVENQLTKKLHIKSGNRILLLNPPADFESKLHPLPTDSILDLNASGKYDVALLFASLRSDLEHQSQVLLNHLKPGKIFWVAFPKKSSLIPSDLGMNQGWESLNARGLQGVSMIALNEEWSAMRFKPLEEVNLNETSNRAVRQSAYSEYIHTEEKQITLPDDVIKAFTTSTESKDRFARLSFTNKKEYLVWILTAKNPETRNERIAKSLEKLSAGKKNPSEK